MTEERYEDALALEAQVEQTTLLGVVPPEEPEEIVRFEVPYETQLTPRRTFERTAEAVLGALGDVRMELTAKREMRDALNNEIRQLVTDENLLRRMARLARETNGDGDADDGGGANDGAGADG